MVTRDKTARVLALWLGTAPAGRACEARDPRRASPGARWCTLLWLIAAAGGCRAVDTFECTVHSQCGSVGVCEANGRCSFIDRDCPSGRRYGEYAGDVSGDCTPHETATDGAAGTSGSSSSASTSSGAAASSGPGSTSGERQTETSSGSGSGETETGGSSTGGSSSSTSPTATGDRGSTGAPSSTSDSSSTGGTASSTGFEP